MSRKWSRRCFTVSVLMAANGLLAPGATAESYVSLGYGALPCATWTTTRASRPKEAETYAAWVYGFVSAYNAYVFQGPNVVEGADTTRLSEWIDGFCLPRGADNLDAAAKALIDEHLRQIKAKASESETSGQGGG